MNVPQFPAGLAALAPDYDTILCDVWGVIHNGRAAFTEACEALVKFRQQGGQVSLITNAPVPNKQVIRLFEPLGVPHAVFDTCVSSGDATRAELAARPDMTVWRMGGDEGWEHDRFLYEGLGHTFIDDDRADLLLCIGLRDQVKDQPEDYRAELARAAAKGIAMLCANPDKQVRVGGKLYWCAGALADIYEDLGGEVIYPGKPCAPIYTLAVARLSELKSPPKRILCIGDSPATDVRGARLQGFDSLYVGTGLKQHGPNFEAEVTDLLADYGEEATYAMTGLRW
ncbi:MAG: TIGR01459 family HAD-type hydrolase [Hyphomonas sp.]|uniref:TIGR01459 family HAD-type hydrolase n=1 Tax=Hyphomonas sp. TaxID=87 RepID=UPI0034A09B83